MDLFDVDDDEPGSSGNPQATFRQRHRGTGGNGHIRRPPRRRGSHSSNPDKWHGPHANFPAMPQHHRGNANANRRYTQRSVQRGGRNLSLQNNYENTGNQLHNDVNRRNHNNRYGMDRPTRSMSQLNLDEDEHQSNQSNRKGKYVGFKFLFELSQMDSKQVITSVNEKRDAFLRLLDSPIEKPDLYVLIMKVITIACSSSFDQLKSNLLLGVCNSQYISNLRNYLMDLPYSKRDSLNSMYWDKPNEFWENFICFCEYVVNTFPSIALNRCRSLIEGTTKCCLEGLSERRGFSLSPEHIEKLEQLRRRLIIQEEDEKKIVQPQRSRVIQDVENEPPENFRQLSILPQREDLIGAPPYLRPNITEGAYSNIEHYLDVQFRLLREDCFGPLRDGISKYLDDPKKKKFDNIRVFRNVKFISTYSSKQKLGCVVQLDENSSKYLKKFKWAHSKRFIYGSLLLFTKDNCKSFIIGTVLDRDVKYLAEGKIPVSLVEGETTNDNICNDDESYVMLESEVYFEPYVHVLKALQDPKFPEDLAMSKYIVKVDPHPQPPAYVNDELVYKYKVKSGNSRTYEFKVLNQNTWPSNDEMGLNESQYEAYRLALTHEFAVIQGPPGTGKTFIGIQIATTLLKNLSVRENGCLLLLVCYTNHALDQFLEAIIPITDSIVRIGGQSRNEAMEQFNLNTIRRTGPKIQHKTNKLFLEQRSVLRRSMIELNRAQEEINAINYGVLSYTCISKYIPESEVIGTFYKHHKDPLAHWLFAKMPKSFDENLLNEFEEDHVNNEEDEDIFMRNNVIYDDFEDECDEAGIAEVSSSFSVGKTETKLRMLISYYRKSKNFNERKDLVAEMTLLSSRLKLFQEMSAICKRETPRNLVIVNPDRCSIERRWMIYFGWAQRVIRVAQEKIKPLQDALLAANNAYEETRMMMDLEVMKNVKVVGMTTSGAARLRKLLKALAPPIVIVEEAAEVLEQHIVTSLTKHCQHLILIGDHQQLRPSAAHMLLAKRYNLEVSLFERMIKNKVHSRRLNVQHRMRPEIAALVSPHIYPDLLNHHTVANFPRILGMTTNLFFFTHNYNEEEVDESSSKANHKEADMVLRLANYLMQQGYDPSDITVLAAYSGQMFYMRKQRERYAHLAKVKITVVDNYQGEESKIILLSLVRNNKEGRIGFLETENRVCVALSRAREGFYIFGNIHILKAKSKLWQNVAETLENNGSLGTSLRLQCEIHTNQITTVASPKDFEKVPEGGCLLKCNFNLRHCDHKCPLICHGYDREHLLIKCPLPCERIICELEHKCPLKCSQQCAPCVKPVLKELPCGHTKSLACSWDPKDPRTLCQINVTVNMPHCNHEAKKPCHLDIKYLACPIRCDARLECGHVCTLKCHVTRDPEHKDYKCQKPCAKPKKGCSVKQDGELGPHQCRNKCYEACENCEVKVTKKRSNCKHTENVACNQSADETPCRKNCARTLPCGHFCRKKCHEPCGDCRQQMKKIIPDCKHEVIVACNVEATRELCERRCERTLPCGHVCRGRCGAPCDTASCTELTPHKFTSPCSHKVALPCNVYAQYRDTNDESLLLEHCAAPCGAELACKHQCSGTCGRCRQGRLHAPCTSTCNQIIICGHQCQEPCNQICPPCTKPCEVKCRHSKCKNLCGQPCVPCKEPCSRQCMHGACSHYCDQPCSRAACSQPCPELLPCRHACRGLCGEPCPPVCKLCRPDEFPTDFLGDQFEDDAKFILLEDCNHVLELEDMNNLMFGDQETVSIRSCPFCRKPIVNTHRYKDFVNNMFKKEINPIKERVYGTPQEIKSKKINLKAKLEATIARSPKCLKDPQWRIPDWRKAFNKLVEKYNNEKNVSLLHLEMHFIYLNILEMLSDTYDLYVTENLVYLKDKVINQVSMICKTLMENINKISQQQQKDIGVEIKRLNSIIQLALIMSHSTYAMLRNVSKVKVALENAKKVVTGWSIYNEDNGIIALKVFQETLKVSGIVSKQERELIVKAIGLKAGHWYKCPNGHFYCIGECGGAMQIAKCIECGVQIGGQNHSLLNTNRHAPEMDGSRFAAWSTEYNNMANFNLDFE